MYWSNYCRLSRYLGAEKGSMQPSRCKLSLVLFRRRWSRLRHSDVSVREKVRTRFGFTDTRQCCKFWLCLPGCSCRAILSWINQWWCWASQPVFCAHPGTARCQRRQLMKTKPVRGRKHTAAWLWEGFCPPVDCKEVFSKGVCMLTGVT